MVEEAVGILTRQLRIGFGRARLLNFGILTHKSGQCLRRQPRGQGLAIELNA